MVVDVGRGISQFGVQPQVWKVVSVFDDDADAKAVAADDEGNADAEADADGRC